MHAIINKKAFFDYEVLETLEVGMVLNGSEVKSILGGQVNLVNSFIKILNGEIWLWNSDIPQYKFSTEKNYDNFRARKLLIKKAEIYRLESKMKQGRLTLIPLKIYTIRSRIKMEIGLCKGKKVYEKKLKEKERDLERELHREKRALML